MVEGVVVPVTEKPELRVVLEHYDVMVPSSRDKQMVRCPFHDDRTPSMSVDLRDHLWKCFSCGRGGDSWTLIQECEDIRLFKDAVQWAVKHLDLADSPAPRGTGYGKKKGSGRAYVPSWRRKREE